MTLYELKKILVSTGGKISVLIFAIVVAVSCLVSRSGVEWLDETGEWHTGPAAVREFRAAAQPWEGALDGEKLGKAIEEIRRVTAMPDYGDPNAVWYSPSHLALQNIRPIWRMMVFAYGSGYQRVDETVLEELTPADAAAFYPNRVRLLREWLADPENLYAAKLTAAQKDFLVQEYEALETPMNYSYAGGWEQLLSGSATLLLCGSLVLGFLVAGIFSNEYRWGVDSVLFSAELGRSKAIRAKIGAAFLLVTALYWLGIGIYTLYTLGVLGFDGASCPIQLFYWKSFYRFTYAESYALTVIGGYAGNLFVAFVAMLLSVETRSSAVAVAVPFLAMTLSSVVRLSPQPWLSNLAQFLPDSTMRLGQNLMFIETVDLGVTVMGVAVLMPIVYGILAMLLAPALHLEYRRRSWC